MYVQEIFSGLDYSQFPKISMIENKMNASDVVRISDISMISTCEHHFVTIDGLAKVAYIPGEKIIGLSKINRIVQFFAQRPQVQERLCYQIVLALQTLLGVEDVAVSIDATHYCVKARGVMDSSSTTRTNVLRGKFDSDSLLRAEFLG
jgi:GTP cyclohydrolase I